MALFEQLYPPVVAFGSRTLTGGEQGTDVAVLQIAYGQMRAVMNPPQGPIGPPIPVTGTYDAATQVAVRALQTYFGLAADGVADAETYWLFGQGVGRFTTYGGPPFGSRDLRYGSEGGDVAVLQNRLNCFRYAGLFGQAADGVFGPNTLAVTQLFQQDAAGNGDTGLADDGQVGPETLNAIWIYTCAGGRTLSLGSYGFDVVFIQSVLAGLGFYADAIDGLFGPATQHAVVVFQQMNGLLPDGVVGQESLYRIGVNNMYRPPHPFPVPPLQPTPVAQVNCCFTLDPTPAAIEPTRGASAFIHNGPRSGPSSVAVQFLVSSVLPAASVYGPEFVGYGLRFIVPGGGGSFEPMATCPSTRPDLWVFAFVSGSAGPIELVDAEIAPIRADGAVGPVVLAGQGACPFTG